MTNKLFTVVGCSTGGGRTKLRFANDLVSRLKRLQRCGESNIDLIELPRAMTKLEAAEFLLSIDFADGEAAVAEAIQHVIAKNGGNTVPGGNTDDTESLQQVDPMTVPALM